MPLADLPQTNKMHAVPQNIMDVEFKLIGDLTLRQFIYLFVFGGCAYLSAVGIVGIFKWPSVIFFAMLGVGLAFVPINERGLDEWIVNFVKSVYSPTQRIWLREPTVPSAFMYDNLAVVRQELITLAPTSSRRRLEEYLEYKVADDNQDPLDIPEKEYIMKVRDAFGDVSPSSRSVGVGVLEPEAAYPASAGFGQPYFEQPSPQEPEEKTSEQQPPQEPSLIAPTEGQTALQPSQPQIATPTSSQPTAPIAGSGESSRNAEIRKANHHHQRRHPSAGWSPMTPDMHSGRRFINLVPGSGELVLPIRGERVIRSSEEMEVEEDIQDKAEKLKELLNRIKMDTGAPSEPKQSYTSNTPPVAQSQPQNQDQLLSQEAQSMAQQLKGQQDKLTQEITRLESEKIASPSDAGDKDAQLLKLKTEKEKAQFDYEALQRQISDLQDKFKQKIAITPQTGAKPSEYGYGGTPVSETKPNSITGTVKTKEGSLKEGILLIVKNERGEAVRAVKTNALGQFKLTTPVANGKYTIEVASHDTGSTFDIISIEAKGDAISPVEINGK